MVINYCYLYAFNLMVLLRLLCIIKILYLISNGNLTDNLLINMMFYNQLVMDNIISSQALSWFYLMSYNQLRGI